ncbi:MAG: serine/threonine protein kinase [Planctomycetes bacterium]|nr:serine/threonine protein kinase [Planctomycetota bacterium]
MTDSPKPPADDPREKASRATKPIPPTRGPEQTSRTSDSAPATGGMFAKLPTQFGRYRIEKLLGQGAMGAVYLAEDITLERSVALKVAKVSASGAARILKRMEAEARAGAKIDHPLICKVYDSGEIDGIRFIALQYIEGEDLKSYLNRVGRRREPAEAVGIVFQLAQALQAAHEQGVIHRDLKPENVMLRPDGAPVIMDFGLARQTTIAGDARLTLAGTILGSAAYMSPEQARGTANAGEIDHRSDQYALGVILFEMLTGEWPFTGSTIEVMGKKCVQAAPSPLLTNPSLQPQLAAICHTMIAHRKADRFSSCADVAARLEVLEFKENDPEWSGDDPCTAFDVASAKPAARRRRAADATVKVTNARSLQTSTPGLHAQLTTWWKTLASSKRGIVASSLGLTLLLAAIMWSRSGAATVRIEVLNDNLEVRFQRSVITLADGEQTVKAQPGSHSLRIKSGDLEFDTASFPLKRGDNPMVTVELRNAQVVTKVGNAVVDRRTLTDVASEPWRTVHLLQQINVPRDSASGQWEITSDRSLKQTAGGDAQIRFSDQFPTEYSVSFEGTRTPMTPLTNRSLGIVLPMQGRSVMVHIDTDSHDTGGLSGLVSNQEGQWEESTRISGQQLPDGETFRVRCIVRHDSIDIFWQGRRRIHWQGQPGDLGCPARFLPKGAPVFSLVCQGPYEFSKLRLAPLKLLDTDDVDLLNLVDVQRDALQDAFQTVDGGIEAVNLDPNRDSILELPVEPPEEYTLRLTAKRTSTIHAIIVGLVAGGQPVDAVFDLKSGEGGGLELINGQLAAYGPTALPKARFVDQVPFDLECRVSRERIVILGDGCCLIDWPVDAAHFARANWHTQSTGLILGTDGSYEFSRVRLGPLPKPQPPPKKLSDGERIDLLAIIEPERDAIHGVFQKNADGSITFPNNLRNSKLRIPAELPAEYEIYADIDSPGDGHQLVYNFPMAETRGELIIDCHGRTCTGLFADGSIEKNVTSFSGTLLPRGSHQLILGVSPTGVQFRCDGNLIVDWRGNPRRLQNNPFYAVPGNRCLGLGSWTCAYRINKLEVRPLSAPSLPFPPPIKPVNGDLLAIIETDRDSIDGRWTREATIISSPWRPEDYYSVLHVPHALPDQFEITTTVKRREGAEAFAISMPIGRSRGAIQFDGWASRWSGVYRINGEDMITNGSRVPGNQLVPGEAQRVRIRVARESADRYSVRAFVNDREVVTWVGNPSQISDDLLPPGAEERDPYLRTWAGFEISELTYRPLNPADRDSSVEVEFARRHRQLPEAARLRMDWPNQRKLVLDWDVKWFRLPANVQRLLTEFPSRTDESAEMTTERKNLKWSSEELDRNPLGQVDWFGLRAKTSADLPAGRYVVFTSTDDGVRVRVDDQVVFEHWNGRQINFPSYSEFMLTEGSHTIQVDYFEFGGSNACHVEFARAEEIPGQ